MPQRYQEYLVFQGRTMHPVMQVLVGLLTIAVLAGLFFLGLAFFTVFAGVAVVAGLVLWLRLKWLMWRRNREGTVERMAPTEQTGDAIEGDYEIIEHDSEPRS
jgi:predicted lysophospholipase L1 biosynthesis ABC-type transport system permease subunit